MTAGVTAPDDFPARVEAARAAGRLQLDLTESDPARCGLGWGEREVAALLEEGRASGGAPSPRALEQAREAVASYLAGHRVSVPPGRVFFAGSRGAAGRLALAAVCPGEGELLVPSPARLFHEPAPSAPQLRARRYALDFGEEWRLERRSLRRAVGPSSRAIVVGNPADPTGAMLSAEELAALDELCAARGLALVGDEAFLDTALGASASVARATRCLAAHVSGLSGVCGLPGLAGEWVALAGPDALVAPAAARLRSLAATPAAPAATLHAIPALLARREPFLEALRDRLARNRGAVAAASLREAPWTLQWGGGGSRAVLQINPFRDETELCRALLEEGVAVEPGHLHGLPPAGFLVLSLLPEPAVFLEGIDRLEARLRRLA